MTMLRDRQERRRSRIVLLAAGSLVLVCALGCQTTKDAAPPKESSHPVVLIGIDGLEWATVLRMASSGRLPTLAGLMRRGTFGALEVTKPTLSPILWTSIATGTKSSRHGIRGFVHGEQKTGVAGGTLASLYTSNDRRVKAFWNILSEAGYRVHTIGWWLTYPAERVNGVMVAQVNTVTPRMRRSGQGIWKGQLVEGLLGQVYPPERESEILAMIPAVAASTPALVRTIFGTPAPGAPSAPAEMLEQSLWAFRADALYHRVALDVLRNDGPFDLFAVYFGGADVVGHRFWRHAYPELYRHPPADDEQQAFGHVLEAYYGYLDSIIASLIEAAPPDADILVVSDHGMEPVRRNGRFRAPALSGGHLSGPPAVVIAAGPDIRADGRDTTSVSAEKLERIGSILDVTPTILALLGMPIGRDMDGDAARPLLTTELLERHPIRYVSAYTEPRWFADRPKVAVAEADSSERIEQLRALGYLTE
jgi:hypothetical protein